MANKASSGPGPPNTSVARKKNCTPKFFGRMRRCGCWKKICFEISLFLPHDLRRTLSQFNWKTYVINYCIRPRGAHSKSMFFFGARQKKIVWKCSPGNSWIPWRNIQWNLSDHDCRSITFKSPKKNMTSVTYPEDGRPKQSSACPSSPARRMTEDGTKFIVCHGFLDLPALAHVSNRRFDGIVCPPTSEHIRSPLSVQSVGFTNAMPRWKIESNSSGLRRDLPWR